MDADAGKPAGGGEQGRQHTCEVTRLDSHHFRDHQLGHSRPRQHRPPVRRRPEGRAGGEAAGRRLPDSGQGRRLCRQVRGAQAPRQLRGPGRRPWTSTSSTSPRPIPATKTLPLLCLNHGQGRPLREAFHRQRPRGRRGRRAGPRQRPVLDGSHVVPLFPRDGPRPQTDRRRRDRRSADAASRLRLPRGCEPG